MGALLGGGAVIATIYGNIKKDNQDLAAEAIAPSTPATPIKK